MLQATRSLLSIISVLLCFVQANAQSVTNEEAVRDFAYESLGKAVFTTIQNDLKSPSIATIADPGGLILVLGEINRNEARNLLLELSQVYIGSANAEALTYAVWQQGKKMVAALQALRNRRKDCSFLTKYSLGSTAPIAIRCSSRDERDRRIRHFIELIRSGRKLDYPL